MPEEPPVPAPNPETYTPMSLAPEHQKRAFPFGAPNEEVPMTKKVRLSRRSVLRGSVAGIGIAVGLPPLEAMFNGNGTALAAGGALPTRFGLWFWGNGVRLSKWNPVNTGPNYTLSESLASLASVKSKIAVVSGTNVRTPDLRAHHSGQAAILTGAPPLAQPPKNGSPFDSTFRTASVDQMVAAAIGTKSRFRSIQVGVIRQMNDGGGTTLKHISHNGPDNANPAECDAQKVFTRLFSDSVGPTSPSMPGPMDVSQSLRKSVLDAVLQDLSALQSKVSDTDRKRLDQHAQNVRALEMRLATTGAGGSETTVNGCKKLTSRMVLPGIAGANKNMAELVTMALACDLTRVFSCQFSTGVDMTIFKEAGVNSPHHQLTHDEPGDQPEVQKISAFIVKQFAFLVESLAAIQEGEKSLLDNCAILGTSDCAEGQPHSLTDYPILIAGSAGGRLRTGMHYRSNGENATQVLVSLMRAVGHNVAELGQGNGRATTGLAAIES